jgi:hypothetical protein
MTGRLLKAALALPAFSVLAFLLLRQPQPKPIARVSLGLPKAAELASGAADSSLREGALRTSAVPVHDDTVIGRASLLRLGRRVPSAIAVPGRRPHRQACYA